MKIKRIENNGRVYEYDADRFVPSYQYINKEESKRILEDCKTVFEDAGLKFTLIMGTLLGAYRDKDFIEWDYDIDVAIKSEVKGRILDLIPALENLGILVCRYDGNLLSFERNGSYIDFYFFRPYFLFWRKIMTGIVTKASFFNQIKLYKFLDTEYFVPADIEGYLRYHYGDWRTPDKNSTLIGNNIYIKVREYVRNNHPGLFRTSSWVKSKFRK